MQTAARFMQPRRPAHMRRATQYMHGATQCKVDDKEDTGEDKEAFKQEAHDRERSLNNLRMHVATQYMYGATPVCGHLGMHGTLSAR